MEYKSVSNVTVIIRASGERTLKTCYEIIKSQVHEKSIFVLEETPFHRAVKKTFEIGLKENREWTLAVDADVFLRKNAIYDMQKQFSLLDQSYFVFKGLYFDYFYQIYRDVGAHMYRTSLLKEALKQCEICKDSLRPESDIYRLMTKSGYHYYVKNSVYGLHDFEQSYFDIFRKCFLHAHKHRSHVPRFLSVWKSEIGNNKDYQVALYALSEGLMYSDHLNLDLIFFKNKFRESSLSKNLIEKGQIELSLSKLHLLNNLIKNDTSFVNIDSKIKRRRKGLFFKISKSLTFKLYRLTESSLFFPSKNGVFEKWNSH